MSAYWRDKAVVVTGGSSGLGWEMVRQLVRSGASVANLDIALPQAGNGAQNWSCDVTNEAQVNEVMKTIAADFNGIDVVISNAGIGAEFPLVSGNMSTLRRMFEVNFFGSLNVARAAVPHLRETDGQVLFVSSLGAFIKAPLIGGGYGASKAAVFMAANAFRQEVEYLGIRVSVAILSRHDTPMDETAFETEAAAMSPFNVLPPAKPANGARRMLRGLEKDKQTIYAPWWAWWLLNVPFALQVAHWRFARKMPPELVALAVEAATITPARFAGEPKK